MQATDEPIDVIKSVFTVQDFVSWLEASQLNLRPYFQRGSVWSPSARSFLIDSLLRGYPLPIIFLQTKRDPGSLRAVRQVVDGQQRLRAILGFVRPDLLPLDHGEAPVVISRVHNPSLAGASFADLSAELKIRLLDTELAVHTLPDGIDDAVLLELFARMNSTGEKLNAQELRNARYHGEFKTLAYRLSYEHVSTWERWKLFSRTQIAKMSDVEFVSELMMVAMDGVEGKSSSRIDKSYKTFDARFEEKEAVSDQVRRTLAHLDEANTPPVQVLASQSWAYAVAATLIVKSVKDQNGLPPVSETRRNLMKLDHAVRDVSALPEKLQKALRGASTDKSSRVARVDFYASPVTRG